MLIELLKRSQEDLLKLTRKHLKKLGYKNVIRTDNYVFAAGDIPVLLVAHLDTVHKDLPKDIYFDKKKKVLWSPQRNRWR